MCPSACMTLCISGGSCASSVSPSLLPLDAFLAGNLLSCCRIPACCGTGFAMLTDVDRRTRFAGLSAALTSSAFAGTCTVVK